MTFSWPCIVTENTHVKHLAYLPLLFLILLQKVHFMGLAVERASVINSFLLGFFKGLGYATVTLICFDFRTKFNCFEMYSFWLCLRWVFIVIVFSYLFCMIIQETFGKDIPTTFLFWSIKMWKDWQEAFRVSGILKREMLFTSSLNLDPELGSPKYKSLGKIAVIFSVSWRHSWRIRRVEYNYVIIIM